MTKLLRRIFENQLPFIHSFLFIILFSILSLLVAASYVRADVTSTMECRKGFIYTWWDDSCLTQKLQTDFSITATDVPYQTLLDYVNNHENEIIFYLQQIDYGRKVDACFVSKCLLILNIQRGFNHGTFFQYRRTV
jgi:hypothetical protein